MSYVGLLKLADEIADARGRRAGAAADAARVQALLLGSTPV
jgi:hypothetical protein